MRNCVIHNRNRLERFPTTVTGLTDRFTDFVSFSETEPNTSGTISNHQKSTEAKTTPTLHHFGAPIDENRFFEQLRATGCVALA